MNEKEVKAFINSVRRDFTKQSLEESNVDSNPFKQFAKWMDEAVKSDLLDPYAMCISTASKKGVPSSRILYLRDIIDDTFVFYTNYNSSKGMEMSENPFASANFHWGELERQVNITGSIQKVEESVSDAYYKSRPKSSKIGAWASYQSKVLNNRSDLEDRIVELTKKYENTEDVPRPPHWGGYQLIPTKIEFWQGRPSRLHDRIVFYWEENSWTIKRLNP
jgi:pyridoxamine 5'-phosphate oxidase